MEIIYFLGIVAVCAGCIIWFVVKSHRAENSRQKTSNRRAYPLHSPGHHPVLHSHDSHAHNRDIWSARRRHAAEEQRGAYSLTATKINFDSEVAGKDEPEEEVAMTEIKYTPTHLDSAKRSGSKG
ncbi:MAG TPA: hypothetical protein VKN35_08935 [Xanthomonadales bacterium]|nr:hypothetical protein [Xanthomonadales bacterium]